MGLYRSFILFGVLFLVESVTCEKELLQINIDKKSEKTRAFYVTNIIKSWNEKHSETCNVLYFNLGKKSDMTNEIVRSIPEDNAVIFGDPRKCRELESRKGPFIVIETDIFDAVSPKF